MATPSHVDLSVLWVPIMPETSGMDAGMEEAGKKAKDSFAKSTKDIGKPIEEAVTKAGEQASQSMEEAGKRASIGFGGAFRDLARDVGSTIKGEIGGAFHDIGAAARSGDVAGAFDGIKGKVADIADLTKKVGFDIGDWHSPVAKADDDFKGMADQAHGVLDNVTGISSQFTSMPGKIGRVASKLGELGVIAGTVVETLNAIKDADHWLEDKMPWYKNLDEQFKDNPINKFFHDHLGSHPADQQPDGPMTQSGGFGGSNGIEPYPMNFVGPLPPGAVRAPNGVAPPLPAASGPGNFYKDWYSPSGSDWDATAKGESGGKWDTNTGNGFYGGLQFTQSSWEEAGGLVFAPRADLAPPWAQKKVAERLFQMQGPGAWPNTYKRLPSGAGGGSSRSSGGSARGGSDFSAGTGDVYTGPHTDDTHGLLVPAAASLKSLVGQMFGVTDIGGYRPPDKFKEHSSGEALDIMVGANKALGNQINQFLQRNASALGLQYTLWQQQEWDPGKGPTSMSDRGSPTENHMDHIHARLFPGPMRGGGQFTAGGGKQIPTGQEHDPIYTTATGPGGQSSGSPFESQGSQLGQGLVNGVLQMFGLDGSVFGGKSPLDWGAVKMGGGLLNWGMHAFMPGANGSGGGGGMPAMGGGGGIGGMLSAFMPKPGAGITTGAAAGGSFGIKDATSGPTSVHYNMPTNITGNTIADVGTLTQQMQWKQHQDSRVPSILSGMPQSGPGQP